MAGMVLRRATRVIPTVKGVPVGGVPFPVGLGVRFRVEQRRSESRRRKMSLVSLTRI